MLTWCMFYRFMYMLYLLCAVVIWALHIQSKYYTTELPLSLTVGSVFNTSIGRLKNCLKKNTLSFECCSNKLPWTWWHKTTQQLWRPISEDRFSGLLPSCQEDGSFVEEMVLFVEAARGFLGCGCITLVSVLPHCLLVLLTFLPLS